MKLGINLYRHMLNRRNYDFARQCGATHLIVHMVDYRNQLDTKKVDNQPVGDLDGWGVADSSDVWTVEELSKIKGEAEEAGLIIEALENLSPAIWHDILLDGPLREEQIEKVKQIIRNMGEVGIPILGYYFSLAGVCGRVTRKYGRGNALTVGLDGENSELLSTPLKKGMVWNMIYDVQAPPGNIATVEREELWGRLEQFLDEILPVAELSGVRLAAHPDDPPLPMVRQQPRLIFQPSMYQRLIEISDSPSNNLELCIGTLAEMKEGDIYQMVENYVSQNRVAYIHLRNVRGKVPYYMETFIDDGDVDIPRIFEILDAAEFKGVVIPDHTPQMSCDAPWHSGQAHCLGYFKSQLDMLQRKKR